MSESHPIVRLILPPIDPQRMLDEAPDRGYLSHVLVEIDGSRLYPVFFYTAGGLQSDLDTSSKNEKPYIAETGMIVLKALTLENMQAAVEGLHSGGYFDYQIPLTRDRVSEADPFQWPP